MFWKKLVVICFGCLGLDRYGFYFNYIYIVFIDIELEVFNKGYLFFLKYEFGNLWLVIIVVVFLLYCEIVMYDLF